MKFVRSSVIAAYAAVTASVPLMVLSVHWLQPIERVQAISAAEVTPEEATAAGDAEAVRALAGMWWKALPGLEGSDVGFYYFHGDGKGLYRYGKVGIANTHSFDYDVAGDTLVLRFRKSGARHELPFRVESEGELDWLTLDYDPETQTHGARYFRDRPGPIEPHAERVQRAELGQPPAGHMWIDLQRYATGGIGFHMYQFRPAGIDGRGVGWFHRGDFDDWSTEAFTYRIAGDALSLHFTVADRREVTRFGVEPGQPRTLRLQTDPGDYWHPHAYLDMGASFGSLPPGAWALAVDAYSRTE